MKRKIALFVAAVMMASFLPAMNVLASVRVSVALGAKQVATDTDWGEDASRVADCPVVTLTQDGSETLTEGSVFTINLKNAQWSTKNLTSGGALPFGNTVAWASTGTDEGTLYVPVGSKLFNKDGYTALDIGYTMRIQDKTTAEVTIDDRNGTPTEGKIYLPIFAKLTGEGAAQAIFNDSVDSGVANNTPVTIANATVGDVSVTIDEEKQTSKSLDLGNIKIEETIANKIDVKSGKNIELSAPAGFVWATGNASVLLSRGFKSSGSGVGTPGIILDDDDETALIAMTSGNNFNNGLNTTSTAGTVTIKGLTLKKDEGATYGTLKVRVSVPGADSYYITVGEYTQSKIEMIAENKTVPEILNGIYPNDESDTSIRTLDVTIKENTLRAWTLDPDNKDNIFVLNNGDKNVRFRYVKVVNSEGIRNASGDVSLTSDQDIKATAGDGNSDMQLSQDKLTLRFERPDNSTTEAMVKLRLGVSVKPGFTGDIVFGTHEDNDAIGQELSVAVAKAVNPLTVVADKKAVVVGQMDQPLGDITIKENIAGTIPRSSDNKNAYMLGTVSGNHYAPSGTATSESKDLKLWIKGTRTISFAGTPTTTVTSGDLLVDTCKVEKLDSSQTYNDEVMGVTLKVKRASSTASEIKIAGLEAIADRYLNNGKYHLRASGFLTANYVRSGLADDLKKYAGFDVDNVIVLNDYVTIGGSADGAAGTAFVNKVEVEIGSPTIKVNGVETNVEVPSFIEGNNSYIPVRAVVVALGIKDDEVKWDANTKTASITGLAHLVEFTQGSEYIRIDGSNPGFKMDNGATVKIRNNRVFLPVRALGEIVLHCPVNWDPATRVATFN